MRSRNILYTLLPLACILCNISQLPDLWNNRMISLAYQGVWLIILLIALRKVNMVVLVPNGVLVLSAAIGACMLLSTVITGGAYFSSSLWKAMVLSLFVFFTSTVAGLSVNEDIVKPIAYAYVLSAFVDAVMIFRSFFSGVNWLNATGYIYTAKNSIAVIFMTAIILIYYYIFSKYPILSAVVIAWLSLFIFMLKSRATIVVWCLCAVYILCIDCKNTTRRILGILVCFTAICLVIYHPVLNEMIVKQILLNNRTADLTTLSSGRDVHYELFANMFPQYFWLGTGGTYLECFILAALLSYGVVGGIPVIILSIYPLLVALKAKRRSNYRNNTWITVILLLNIVLWVNGLFEELTPFGPGVKCYMLWMLTGLYLGNQMKRKRYGHPV